MGAFQSNFDKKHEKITKILIPLIFLLKGHKMFNFLFAFFLKISETLKAHISGTEANINER